MTFQAKTSTRTFSAGVYRDLPGSLPGSSPGFTGKFPGMWLSLLWIHWEILGSAGELTEEARDLPGYRDKLPGISPVNFQFLGRSLYLFLLGTLHIMIINETSNMLILLVIYFGMNYSIIRLNLQSKS